jgi:hypothetical protein
MGVDKHFLAFYSLCSLLVMGSHSLRGSTSPGRGASISTKALSLGICEGWYCWGLCQWAFPIPYPKVNCSTLKLWWLQFLLQCHSTIICRTPKSSQLHTDAKAMHKQHSSQKLCGGYLRFIFRGQRSFSSRRRVHDKVKQMTSVSLVMLSGPTSERVGIWIAIPPPPGDCPGVNSPYYF